MARQSMYSQCFEDSLSQAQTELLEALLQPEEAAYPWNVAEPSSDDYLAELEREFELQDWSDEEIAWRSQRLFALLDECSPQAPSLLGMSLYKKFAAQVPEAWLEAIAQKAQEVFSSNLSLPDQLIQCVHQLLPNWAEEDLQNWARPLAYAMRSLEPESIESELLVVRPVDWTELSEMEQARLSMTIAWSTLANLHSRQAKGL